MPTRLETLEVLVSRAPGDPFPYYCLAQEYRSAKRTDEALAAFARLRDRFPDYVPQYLMAAQVCQETNRIPEARAWTSAGITVARRTRDTHSLGELESMLATLPE